jgi:hypothetical protein
MLVLATTYGWGEKMCGDIGFPVSCTSQQVMANGQPLDSLEPTVAVPMPQNYRHRPGKVCVRHLQTQREVWLRVTDKHLRPNVIDLTPAAVAKIGGKVRSTWSAKITLCGSSFRPEFR